MLKYGFQCKFQAKEGKSSALPDILTDTASVVSTAQGFQLYVVRKDLVDGDAIWVYEVWDNKQDHEKSISGKKALSLLSNLVPLLAAPPSHRTELQILGGVGLD